MYAEPLPEVEKNRVVKGRLASNKFYGNNGAFQIPGPERANLFIIASDQLGWEHVSISVLKKPHRTPTWAEMCFVKDLFWKPEEVVIQYHPAKSDYVTFHDWTLHLWRPIELYIPTPPHGFVGPKTVEDGLDLLAKFTGRRIT